MKWKVYEPGVVGMKKASNSPLVPRPESASNEGTRGNVCFDVPVSTESWIFLPMLVTGWPFGVLRNICTKFLSPV